MSEQSPIITPDRVLFFLAAVLTGLLGGVLLTRPIPGHHMVSHAAGVCLCAVTVLTLTGLGAALARGWRRQH